MKNEIGVYMAGDWSARLIDWWPPANGEAAMKATQVQLRDDDAVEDVQETQVCNPGAARRRSGAASCAAKHTGSDAAAIPDIELFHNSERGRSAWPTTDPRLLLAAPSTRRRLPARSRQPSEASRRATREA